MDAPAAQRSITLRIGFNELVGRPCDGVGLARACGVLYQICLPYTFFTGVRYETAHHIHLVVAWEIQGFLIQRISVFTIKPYKMLDDIGDTLTGKYIVPQVGCFVSEWIGRIAFAEVVPQIKWQKKRAASIQFGGHVGFIGIHCKMHDAATEL